jgi:hypothetical protein
MVISRVLIGITPFWAKPLIFQIIVDTYTQQHQPPTMPALKTKKVEVKNPLIPTGQLSQHFGLSVDYFKKNLKNGSLIEGLHVFRAPNSTSLLWNHNLIRSWLVNGPDSSAHKADCERFSSSLQLPKKTK